MTLRRGSIHPTGLGPPWLSRQCVQAVKRLFGVRQQQLADAPDCRLGPAPQAGCFRVRRAFGQLGHRTTKGRSNLVPDRTADEPPLNGAPVAGHGATAASNDLPAFAEEVEFLSGPDLRLELHLGGSTVGIDE